MAGVLNKNGGQRSVTFIVFSLYTGTDWKTISWYIDVLHQHGCCPISSGLQESISGQEERGIAEKSVTKEQKDQREDGLCTIQGKKKRFNALEICLKVYDNAELVRIDKCHTWLTR